jgi:hypothetical protein
MNETEALDALVRAAPDRFVGLTDEQRAEVAREALRRVQAAKDRLIADERRR